MNSQNNRDNGHVQEIRSGAHVLAIIYRSGLPADGVKFLTPPDYPLQVGILDHKEGKRVSLHKHQHNVVSTDALHEFLYFEKGEADVEVGDDEWNIVQKTTLRQGDMILFVQGCHRLDIKPGARIVEVKQGPYQGDERAKIIHSP